MTELQRIGDVAARFNISGRTLRYYEEIGILESIRGEDSLYRYYDSAAITRVEQILFLRQLQFSIKDIQDIFSSQDYQTVAVILARKITSLQEEIERLESLKEIAKTFRALLTEKGYSPMNGLPQDSLPQVGVFPAVVRQDIHSNSKEAYLMSTEIKKPLTDIRIIELKPIRVAYYRAESASPEMDAWNTLMPWIEERRLHETAATRFFGFNNPAPTPNNPVYGYEVWATIPESCAPSGAIQAKVFSGGLYAVACAQLYEIFEKWQLLASWVKDSTYSFGDHQCLEETISPVKMPHNDTQFDLYFPIIRK